MPHFSVVYVPLGLSLQRKLFWTKTLIQTRQQYGIGWLVIFVDVPDMTKSFGQCKMQRKNSEQLLQVKGDR